jgi:hypothetical protein
MTTKTTKTFKCSMRYQDLTDNLKVWRVRTYKTKTPSEAAKKYVDDTHLPGGSPLGPYHAYEE